MSRVCKICKKEKFDFEFYDTPKYACKVCLINKEKAKHKENIVESLKYKNTYYHKNKEAYYQRQKIYIRKHKYKNRLNAHKRRLRLKGLSGSYNNSDILTLFINQNGRCIYCSCVLDKFDIDHIIPISREGSSNDISNLQLLCPSCNRPKNNKTHEEYLTWLNLIKIN